MTLRERLEAIEKATDRLSISGDSFRADEWRKLRDDTVPTLLRALLLAIEQRDRAWFRVGDARHDQEWALKGIAADQDELLAILEGKVTT
jgi:hypothetical protein